jgi:DNA repair protein RecO (recombination protein O)
MLHKTRGIVLGTAAYNDKYSLAPVYTEKFGKVTYIISSRKAKTSRCPRSLFHCLAVLEMEVEHRNLRDFQRIKEARAAIPLNSVLSDPVKSAISIFLAELTGKIIVETQENRLLFEFLLRSVEIFELTETSYSNFHLAFMVGLSRFLGIYPDGADYSDGAYFDLREGIFSEQKPAHPDFLNPPESKSLYNLLRINYENMSAFRFSRHERKSLIESILNYYRLHLANFREIKSVEILHEVFG